MPELLLELLSEEIPARMQAGAESTLRHSLLDALAPLSPRNLNTYSTPRRIAAVLDVDSEVPAATRTERGPRTTAPEAALSGFLRKHNAPRDQLVAEAEYWVLHIATLARPAASLIAEALPPLLRRFPWPKSMRWGGTSNFTWVRPLRRILCLLGGTVVPFDLRDGTDDGHGLASANLTEGHPFLSPGAVPVRDAADWQTTLRARHVILDAAERQTLIATRLTSLAEAAGVTLVQDKPLLEEVANLVEWPVPMLGRIDPAYMDLPPEVMQVSMRVNQRYFALRDSQGQAAPFFGFVANIAAPDSGAAITAGNERVLRARFADARHFWELDRRSTLVARVGALESIVFHTKIGNQLQRTRAIARLAELIAPQAIKFQLAATPEARRLLTENAVRQSGRAALLAKADLTTALVGEFSDLQGVIGGYCAIEDDEDANVAAAIRQQYKPNGPSDSVPTETVSIALALADKLYSIAAFFKVGERPSGSSDVYALRRSALGIVRIIRENGLVMSLSPIILASTGCDGDDITATEVLSFIKDRLKIQLRSEGIRHDILDAAFDEKSDDINWLVSKSQCLTAFLDADVGSALLAAYRRAANILRSEEKRIGHSISGEVDQSIFAQQEEFDLNDRLSNVSQDVFNFLRRKGQEQLWEALRRLASLRSEIDAFMIAVRILDDEARIRRNRFLLLAAVRDLMNSVADFSKIEG